MHKAILSIRPAKIAEFEAKIRRKCARKKCQSRTLAVFISVILRRNNPRATNATYKRTQQRYVNRRK